MESLSCEQIFVPTTGLIQQERFVWSLYKWNKKDGVGLFMLDSILFFSTFL